MEDIRVDAHGVTDVGRVRTVNEDQFLIAAMHKVMEVEETSLPSDVASHLDGGALARMYLVADGVGGNRAGDEASRVALETILSYVTTSMKCFYQLDQHREEDLVAALIRSVECGHEKVMAAAASDPDREGMATTLTLVHVLWPRAYIIQVGDSRCYLFRGGAPMQVTRDQTLAQDLVDNGVLEPEQAEATPWSHVLSSAIGNQMRPEAVKLDLEPDDVLLMCTDGLTKHVQPDQIAETLHACPDAEAACERLRDMALDDGGSDNITIIIARFLPL